MTKQLGWGIANVLREVVRRDPEKDLKDDPVIIQGIGHVGKNFARTINQFGAKIIAISDSARQGFMIPKV